MMERGGIIIIKASVLSNLFLMMEVSIWYQKYQSMRNTENFSMIMRMFG